MISVQLTRENVFVFGNFELSVANACWWEDCERTRGTVIIHETPFRTRAPRKVLRHMASVRNMAFVLMPWLFQNTDVVYEMKTLFCYVLYVKHTLLFFPCIGQKQFALVTCKAGIMILYIHYSTNVLCACCICIIVLKTI